MHVDRTLLLELWQICSNLYYHNNYRQTTFDEENSESISVQPQDLKYNSNDDLISDTNFDCTCKLTEKDKKKVSRNRPII